MISRVQGLDGRSRGITRCCLQSDRCYRKWDLIMLREDGSGVTLYPKSETPIVRCEFWKLRYGPWKDIRWAPWDSTPDHGNYDPCPPGFDEYSQRIVEDRQDLQFDTRKAPYQEPPQKRHRTTVEEASNADAASSSSASIAAVAATPAVAACSGDEAPRSHGFFQHDPPEPSPPTTESSQDTLYGPERCEGEVAEVAAEESQQLYAELNDIPVVMAKHPTTQSAGGETDVISCRNIRSRGSFSSTIRRRHSGARNSNRIINYPER